MSIDWDVICNITSAFIFRLGAVKEQQQSQIARLHTNKTVFT